jgi:hypothetical protein
MLDIGNIIQGYTNNLLGINKDLKEKRLNVCYTCPLYTKRNGGMCNNKLWYNPNSGDVSMSYKDNYIRGCGCILSAKTSAPNAHCPVGKW